MELGDVVGNTCGSHSERPKLWSWTGGGYPDGDFREYCQTLEAISRAEA
jgi:hypothetical protein